MCKKLTSFRVCNSVEFGDKHIAMKHDMRGVPMMGCVKVKVAQSCLTLFDPMDYIVHGILQARILEYLFPSPGDLPNPGIKPSSPT